MIKLLRLMKMATDENYADDDTDADDADDDDETEWNVQQILEYILAWCILGNVR